MLQVASAATPKERAFRRYSVLGRMYDAYKLGAPVILFDFGYARADRFAQQRAGHKKRKAVQASDAFPVYAHAVYNKRVP
jgi:hypothetical protein